VQDASATALVIALTRAAAVSIVITAATDSAKPNEHTRPGVLGVFFRIKQWTNLIVVFTKEL
jgi:hypothetical protein